MNNAFRFPPRFLWGSATSSYQVEGGIENNDWAEAARCGTVPAAGLACDHYRRFEEDFEIAKQLNQNAHRFSIEWARIEPEEGRFNDGALVHYNAVLDALKTRNIVPFVTLHHFTNPLWFSRMGGWENNKSPEYFRRYVEYVVSHLKDTPRFFITINEPSVYVGESYLAGKWPPHKKNPAKARLVSRHLTQAHKLAYRTIKDIHPNASVGTANHFVWFEGASPRSLFDKAIVKVLWYLEGKFLNDTLGHHDFIGLNYYRPRRLRFNLFRPKTFFIEEGAPREEVSDIGWEIFPDGLYFILKKLTVHNLPIYIMENGIADAKDTKRKQYIIDHLKAVRRAMREGVDVRGYFYWSLLDNFEWAYGYSQKFGLVEVDFATQARRVRSSAYAYSKIDKDNALHLEA